MSLLLLLLSTALMNQSLTIFDSLKPSATYRENGDLKRAFFNKKIKGDTNLEKANFIINKNKSLFLQEDEFSITVDKNIDLQNGAVLRYKQNYKDIEILNSELIFVFDKNKNLRQIGDSTIKNIDLSSIDKAISKLISKERVLLYLEKKFNLNLDLNRYVDKVKLKIDIKDNNNSLLIYEINLPEALHLNWVYFFNAETGEFLGRENRVLDAVYGNVYSPSPEVSSLQKIEFKDFAPEFYDSNSEYYRKLYGNNVVSYNCNIGRPQTINTPYGTSTICGLTLDAEANEVSENLEFSYLPDEMSSDDTFASIQMYYHVNLVHNYFWERFGNDLSRELMPKLTAVSNYHEYQNGSWARYDNAFFAPAVYTSMLGFPFGDAIVFGQGSSCDYAYDGDVIYHEYTHGVVDKTSSLVGYNFDKYGLSAEPGAMNEGYADYFSSTIANDSIVGNHAGVSRDLDNDLKCSEAVKGESHYDSRYFSGSLWKIRESLGSEIADRIIFKAMASLPSRCSMNEARVITENVAAEFSENYRDIVHQAFESHGLVDCDRAKPYDSNNVQYDFIGGKSNSDNPLSTREFGTSYMQYKVTVPEGKKSMRIDFTTHPDQWGWSVPTPLLSIVIKKGEPVTFSLESGTPIHNGDYVIDLKSQTGSTTIQGPCFSSGDWYIHFLNYGGSGIFTNLDIKLLETSSNIPLYDSCEENRCSEENPTGFCDNELRCIDGECKDSCSEISPNGYCYQGKECISGVCTATCGDSYPNGVCLDLSTLCINRECQIPCSKSNIDGACSGDDICNSDGVCVDACSDYNPTGYCADGAICNEGVCEEPIKNSSNSDGCSFNTQNSSNGLIILAVFTFLMIIFRKKSFKIR
ncbi:hypothetical protein JXR93_04920 [bacterium]|nr:hypothetical protein [bacterium]